MAVQPQFRIDIASKEDFVHAPDLLNILHNTLDILNRLEKAFSRSHLAVSAWTIRDASVQSPLHLTLADDSGASASQEAVEAYVSGLRQMESDQLLTEAPSLFDIGALRATQKMISALNSEVARITFSAPEIGQVTCGRRTLENVEHLLAARFTDTGALEGILDEPTVRNTKRFNLYDPLTNEKVTCHFSIEKLEEIRAAWTCRVAVYGDIRYDKHGKPISMVVKSIRPLREGAMRLRDLPLIDITDGVESSEYIRRLRDAG
jgi:hypothetical protein